MMEPVEKAIALVSLNDTPELVLTKLGEGLPAITPPTRSVLHRSAATLASDCGELKTAERLIAIALAGNPPQEIAEELKDLFIEINLQHYFERRGIAFDPENFNNLMAQK